MTTTVPISELSRQTTKVTELAAEEDVILSRRGEAEDLYLSTRERHEREVQAQLITTGMLASLARTRPDVAGEVMIENLPWMAWLPTPAKIECLQELINDLRAGAQTGDLRRFSLDVASWKSTAVAYNDPEVLADLRREHSSAAMTQEESLVDFPGEDDELRDMQERLSTDLTPASGLEPATRPAR